MPFTHLHTHSNYSLLTGASPFEDLLEEARADGMGALALTDRNGLYGAIPFYKKAQEMGIKPIVGSEIELHGQKAVCLARNRAGYSNLCRIVTNRQLQENFDLAEGIVRHADELYVLCADEAVLRKLATAMPRERLFVLLEIFPPSDSVCPSPGSSATPTGVSWHTSQKSLRGLTELAADLRLDVVAGNNVMFATPDRYQTHRILVAVRENILLDDLNEQNLAHPEAYFKSAEQMEALFKDMPEAIENTRRIADDCNLEFELGKPKFPKSELPPGETAFSHLWKLAFDGVRERYQPLRPDVIERLKYELDVINRLGFAEYFLIVWDIVNFARKNNIPIVGRGSAADSLVSYVLGITSVDPIHFDLYFERFLNLYRTDCPDIDLDMCWRRRDEVLKYVYDRYGADQVAMIANHNSYQARSAFRDVARVFGLPLDEINLLSAMLPYYSVASIRDAIKVFPETRGFPIDREPCKSIIAEAERIDGFIRHLSIHVGGIVIGDAPLPTYLPLERATKGLIVTQYDMGPVEDLGLVKIDLLGQRSLSIIRDTVRAVEENYGAKIDLAKIPDGDPKTVALLSEGKTIGCFQIESPGMRNLLQMMQASNIRDVIMGLSLIRPGPSGSGMKELFIRRRMGMEKTTYLAPQLEKVLGDTHGVMLYQEDILKVAEAVAGFTLAEGDVLRKGISKKRDPARFKEMQDRFLKGSAANGVEPEAAQRIWDLICNFASYSYCKAHATTYGHISYQATYLKAHYPAEFLAAVMSNQAGFYETREYLEEARRFGVKILLPDINRSGFFFRAKGGVIRIGLMQIRGFSRTSIKSLVRARQTYPFTSLADFCRRVKISHPEIENLILCGAMDGFDQTRPELLWRLKLMRSEKRKEKQDDGKQLALFDEQALTDAHFGEGTQNSTTNSPVGGVFDIQHPTSNAQPAESQCVRTSDNQQPTTDNRQPCPEHLTPNTKHPSPHTQHATRNTHLLPRLPDYSRTKKLELEQHILQLTVTDHPLALHEDKLKGLKAVPSHQLRRYAGKNVTVVGWLVTMRRAVTKKQEYMKFMTIEDRFGTMEIVLFPDTYQKYGHLIYSYGPYVVNARVETEYRCVTLTANWITTLDEISRQTSGDAA